MNYREMTEAQRLAWGAAEDKARIADLGGFRSADALKTMQAAAKTRRKAIGATTWQAAEMVIRANRQARTERASILDQPEVGLIDGGYAG